MLRNTPHASSQRAQENAAFAANGANIKVLNEAFDETSKSVRGNITVGELFNRAVSITVERTRWNQPPTVSATAQTAYTPEPVSLRERDCWLAYWSKTTSATSMSIGGYARIEKEAEAEKVRCLKP